MLRAPLRRVMTGGAVWRQSRCVSSLPKKVKITDVSPRDGLQNEKIMVPTDVKLELIRRLRNCGITALESTAFVSPKAVPQMADAKDVMAGLFHNADGCAVLVPNLKGLEAAVSSGATEVTVLACASETMCQKNTRCSLEVSLERACETIAAANNQGLKARCSLGVSFVCPFEGRQSIDLVAGMVAQLHSAGAYEVGLCDTIGKATPDHTRALIEACVDAGVPVEALAMHMHDTYGQAIGNMITGLQLGVSAFDVSVGGIGGCPFAPGAAGNAASEDFVYTLHGLGIETGIDLDELALTGAWMTNYLGRPHASKAGAALARAAAEREASKPSVVMDVPVAVTTPVRREGLRL